jgi:hypothetical protein
MLTVIATAGFENDVPDLQSLLGRDAVGVNVSHDGALVPRPRDAGSRSSESEAEAFKVVILFADRRMKLRFFLFGENSDGDAFTAAR